MNSFYQQNKNKIKIITLGGGPTFLLRRPIRTFLNPEKVHNLRLHQRKP